MRLKVYVFLVLLNIVMTGSALAANSLQQGKLGLNVGVGNSVFGQTVIPGTDTTINNVVNISGRYLVAKDFAVTGGIGYQSDGGDADQSFFGLTFGGRKYLRGDDFIPFFAFQILLANVDAKTGGAKSIDMSVFDLAGLFGGEYFIGSRFSVEGAFGLGFGQVSDGIADSNISYFGTRTVGLTANLYF